MLINGCQEGKRTPRLTELKCPKCGAWVDVFIVMGGRPGQTGTLASDETCAPAVTKQITNNKECALHYLQRTFSMPGKFIGQIVCYIQFVR